MLVKLLIILITAEAILSQQPSTADCADECPRWVKLNTAPVCFGTHGDQYGHFTTPFNQDILVSQFMLVHRSGTVTCNGHRYSYWGCAPTTIGTLLTDQQNKILAPDASKFNQYGWYNLAGYTSSADALVFCALEESYRISAYSELRLWYGEDYLGITEDDNAGQSCADVYGRLA